MDESLVLVIGAGASGLSAAATLAEAGRPVAILEARDRVGGRIHTLRNGAHTPIDIGAEFVHGAKNETWEIIRSASLETREVPDRHWRKEGGELKEFAFWSELRSVFDGLAECSFDEPFQAYLDGLENVPEQAKVLSKSYVQGFHAAQPEKIGVRALAVAEAAGERTEGTRHFRVQEGYSSIIDALAQRLAQRNVPIHLHTPVRKVSWNPGAIEVIADTAGGSKNFRASAAILTFPLGVLKRLCDEDAFDPPLAEKREAIAGLEMGKVVKIALQFRSRFWPIENLGFIHCPGDPFHTWWTDENAPRLTAWAGGPHAERILSASDSETMITEAVNAAGVLFRVPPGTPRDLLVTAHTFDWSADPYACGAYSYTPAGMIEMPELLAAPLSGTLFFAGEATDASGNQGTVHGAIASGVRAAHDLLESA